MNEYHSYWKEMGSGVELCKYLLSRILWGTIWNKPIKFEKCLFSQYDGTFLWGYFELLPGVRLFLAMKTNDYKSSC